MSRQLDGWTAVVTGAGRGLGRAVATGLAQAGATVWISARTRAELETTARLIREAGGRVEWQQVDLSRPASCTTLTEAVLGTVSHVDVLVNNAAVLDLVSLDRLSPDAWMRTLSVNLTAPALLCQQLLPGMRRAGGSIINVSSRAGVMPFANETAYCASKYGLEGFTRSLALELDSAPVSVNTITPGLRIKPTSVTEADVEDRPEEERAVWNDPALLVPAFLCLARLRGEVSGLRFDAFKLARALAEAGGDLSAAQIEELAE